MLAQGQASSAKKRRGLAADVSSRLIFLKKKKKSTGTPSLCSQSLRYPYVCLPQSPSSSVTSVGPSSLLPPCLANRASCGPSWLLMHSFRAAHSPSSHQLSSLSSWGEVNFLLCLQEAQQVLNTQFVIKLPIEIFSQIASNLYSQGNRQQTPTHKLKYVKFGSKKERYSKRKRLLRFMPGM